MNPHCISLLGMPGAGKTTLGKALAAHYSWDFVDLDTEIERRAGRTIPELFATEGETTFRLREAEALQLMLNQQTAPLVLATGGGTPCFHRNLALLKNRSFTVWLDAPAEILLTRLSATSTHRPLLQGTDSGPALQLRLATLAQERHRCYQQAHLRTTAQTPAALLAALAAGGFPALAGTQAAGGA